MNNKILIVEDSKVFSRRVKDILEKENYECFQAFSLKEAREMLNKNIFNLIVLDLHLPDGEGDELIRNIQSLSETKVVVMTVDSEKQHREQLFQMGILDYIHKDSNIELSLQELFRVIKRVRQGKFGDILVIDDSKFICKQIQTLLSPRNYDVDSCHSGIEGLERIKKKQYDLVILDFEMGDLNGDEVLLKIKKDPKYKKIPVIMLSGSEDQDRIRKVLKSGANDYIKKPFFIEEFLLKIDFFVENAKKDQKIQSQTNKLNNFVKTLKIKVENEVKKNEQQQLMLFAQSRHAQMGEMLSMIAHQWRQPLNALSLVNQMLVEKYKKDRLNDDEIAKFQERSKKQIEYMSQTIDIFRDFFIPKQEKHKFFIDDVIKEITYIFKPLLEINRITLETVNNTNDKTLYGFSNELNQALLNILNNAKDALEQTSVTDKKIEVLLENKENYLYITIKDNAGGIPVELLPKVFDPYFSTKLKQNGTGLGLYMTKVIIEDKFDGQIEVDNDSLGAKFIIKIPFERTNNV